MKRFSSHIFVAVLTFAISILGTTLFLYQSSKTENSQKDETKIEPAQNSELEKDKISKPSELKSLSPYDIEGFINNDPQADIQKIWERLNISGKFNSLSDWKKNESFLGLCNRCEAETFSYNLDEELGDEVLLRIADNSREYCRYLLFKQNDSAENSWKLLGFIDHDFGRYKMPQHSFLLSGGKSFLVVQVQVQSGSGVAQYNDRLFVVRKGKLIELMDYTADGHQSESGYQRNFSGQVIDCKLQKDTAQIEIEFNVNYTGWDEKSESNIVLWRKTQKALYTKSINSQQKTLDSAKSTITEKEIDTIYNIDASTDNDILKYNFRELKTIAQEKGKRNQWLREFLSRCENSREKIVLEKSLRK